METKSVVDNIWKDFAGKLRNNYFFPGLLQ